MMWNKTCGCGNGGRSMKWAEGVIATSGDSFRAVVFDHAPDEVLLDMFSAAGAPLKQEEKVAMPDFLNLVEQI